MTRTAWIAADWGTSNLRLWAIGPAGQILAERRSGDGMVGLAPAQFEDALLKLTGELLPEGQTTEVVICGMAGARQGWAEAPYRQVPCLPAGPGSVPAPARDPRLSVRILPGLCQSNPRDVMRGEETQIAGYLAGDPGFDGTLCLPGTHCKWVRVRDGRVQHFRTAMTGEIFALLAGRSVLRHSVAEEGFSEGAFIQGLDEAMRHPEALPLDLFSIRSASLLSGTAPEAGRARLSGLLIGSELAATRAFWAGLPVAVVGAPALSARYHLALTRFGARSRIADHPAMALLGLRAAHATLAKEVS